MDYANKRIIGRTDGIEAVSQSIFKALQTRRFAHVIYDDQYGCDVYNKIGNESLSQEYLDSDIPSMIEDALANDTAILGISDLSYHMFGNDGVCLSFAVETIFGDADWEGEITDG